MPRLVVVHSESVGRWALLLLTFAVLLGLCRTGAIHVSARLSEAISGHRAVIDPGHGGPDPGAVGRSGLREKDLVLEIAFDLRRLLGRAGIYVTMTRETDRDFGDGDAGGSMLARKRRDLAYRVDLANRLKADVYLSVHANSIPEPQWSGAQVFYNPARPYARELAASIQSAFAAHLGPGYRLAKSGDYRVLNDTTMPAVMIEVGFLSNPEEEALLSQPAYRRRVAEAIFHGMVHYFLLRADQRKRALPTVTVPLALEGEKLAVGGKS